MSRNYIPRSYNTQNTGHEPGSRMTNRAITSDISATNLASARTVVLCREVIGCDRKKNNKLFGRGGSAQRRPGGGNNKLRVCDMSESGEVIDCARVQEIQFMGGIGEAGPGSPNDFFEVAFERGVAKVYSKPTEELDTSVINVYDNSEFLSLQENASKNEDPKSITWTRRG